MSTTALPLRETFGPYRIIEIIGQGGGGVVYRAWDSRLQREVAVKVLQRPHGGDSARAERFVAEARAASALNHPNIVTVFGERDGGRLWGVSLCGPMVIGDMRTQTFATSQPAPEGPRPRLVGLMNAPPSLDAGMTIRPGVSDENRPQGAASSTVRDIS